MKNILTKVLILSSFLLPKVTSAHVGSHLYQLDTASKLALTIDSITGWILNISMGLGAALVLYAAFLYVTARENKDKNEKANTALTYAIIILVIGVLIGGVNIILQRFIF
jgi:uncharacterized membrane protein YidH (DUF202 family)